MTPPDPKPTAPPTVAPASDADIKSWRFHSDPVCDGMMTVGLPAMQTDKRGMLRLIARIEADRAEVSRLRARVAELEEEITTWNLRSQWIGQALCDKKLCGHFTAEEIRDTISGKMDKTIKHYAEISTRAALKPEPKEKL